MARNQGETQAMRDNVWAEVAEVIRLANRLDEHFAANRLGDMLDASRDIEGHLIAINRDVYALRARVSPNAAPPEQERLEFPHGDSGLRSGNLKP